MMNRGVIGTLVTGGVLAAVGYMLMPRRRNRFMDMSRWFVNRIDMRKMMRFFTRAMAR